MFERSLKEQSATISLHDSVREGDASGASSPLSNLFGFGCLVATILLLSGGVQIARADSHQPSDATAKGEAAMSVDPALVAEIQATPAAVAKTGPAAALPSPAQPGDSLPPGTPAVEVTPGIVVLNARGFNYGPPVGEVDTEAMRVESQMPSAGKR